jgi:hypothetical protein
MVGGDDRQQIDRHGLRIRLACKLQRLAIVDLIERRGVRVISIAWSLEGGQPQIEVELYNVALVFRRYAVSGTNSRSLREFFPIVVKGVSAFDSARHAYVISSALRGAERSLSARNPASCRPKNEAAHSRKTTRSAARQKALDAGPGSWKCAGVSCLDGEGESARRGFAHVASQKRCIAVDGSGGRAATLGSPVTPAPECITEN